MLGSAGTWRGCPVTGFEHLYCMSHVWANCALATRDRSLFKHLEGACCFLERMCAANVIFEFKQESLQVAEF